MGLGLRGALRIRLALAVDSTAGVHRCSSTGTGLLEAAPVHPGRRRGLLRRRLRGVSPRQAGHGRGRERRQ
jgi:hypothetical protein